MKPKHSLSRQACSSSFDLVEIVQSVYARPSSFMEGSDLDRPVQLHNKCEVLVSQLSEQEPLTSKTVALFLAVC